MRKKISLLGLIISLTVFAIALPACEAGRPGKIYPGGGGGKNDKNDGDDTGEKPSAGSKKRNFSYLLIQLVQLNFLSQELEILSGITPDCLLSSGPVRETPYWTITRRWNCDALGGHKVGRLGVEELRVELKSGNPRGGISPDQLVHLQLDSLVDSAEPNKFLRRQDGKLAEVGYTQLGWEFQTAQNGFLVTGSTSIKYSLSDQEKRFEDSLLIRFSAKLTGSGSQWKDYDLRDVEARLSFNSYEVKGDSRELKVYESSHWTWENPVSFGECHRSLGKGKGTFIVGQNSFDFTFSSEESLSDSMSGLSLSDEFCDSQDPHLLNLLFKGIENLTRN